MQGATLKDMIKRQRSGTHEKLGERKLPEAATQFMTEPARQGGQGLAWESWLAARPWGFRLEAIMADVYVWQGEADILTPLSMGRYFARAIPNCHATFYPNEGHDLSKHMEEILKTLTEV